MGDLARVVVSIVAMVCVGVFAYGAIAALNFWTRRAEGKLGPGPDKLEEIYARLAAAESLEGRVEELEQRVDFAERLIAQQREADRLGAGPPPGHR